MKNDMYPGRGVQSGCKDCTSRHIGCHIDCEDYATFVKKCAEVRKNRMKDNLIRMTLAENQCHRKHVKIRES